MDTLTDRYNCGACDRTCAPTSVCRGGPCFPSRKRIRALAPSAVWSLRSRSREAAEGSRGAPGRRSG
ncbi:MAG: hypothetical protein K8H88_04810 [Sandaracinaceae bacterium]|nr:hypothetical protein [Sandaracinaceae bacterium]